MQLVGKILSVDSRNLAESTLTDKAPGATTLEVTDASSFPLEGGSVLVEGAVLGYIRADYDLDVLTLEQPLTTTLPADTLVEAVPASPVRTALVDLGGNGEAAPVTVPHALATLLEDGVRAPAEQETVYVERYEDGTLALLDVTGQPAVLTSEALDAVQTTDGAAPTSSPAPTVVGGIGAIAARWTPITNADPVHYEVHLSTDAGFVPGPGTLVVDTTGFSATIRTLPNGAPLVYDVTYFVRVVAYDGDGRAEPSTAQGGQLMRITGPDIAASYVYAGTVSAAQITGGVVQSDLLLSGSIKTATAGARIELGAFGLIEYDSEGNPSVLLGTDGQAFFRGQVQATTLTVTGGMSLRGTANEISRSASLTLAVGSTASSNSPSVVVDFESLLLQEGTGTAGSFLSLTPYSLERVGTQWVATYSDGVTRVFSDTGAFVGTVGSATIGKRSTTQLAAGGPVYYISSNGSFWRDKHLVNGVPQRALDDPLTTLAAWTTSGTAPVVTNGNAALAPAGAGSSTLTSAATYDVQGRELSADLGGFGPLHPTQVVALRVRIDASNYAQAETFSNAGVFGVRLRIVKAGVATVSGGVTYDVGSMANLTLREDEGLFYVGTRSSSDLDPVYSSGYAHGFTKEQLAAARLELSASDAGPLNVVANPDFETNFAGWTGSGTGYSVVSRSTAQKHSGVGSLLVIATQDGDTGATATSTSTAATDAVPITQGCTYAFSWWARMGTATPREMAVRFYWYKPDGSYLSASSVNLGVNAGPDAWTQGSASAVAPAGAAFMAWRVYCRGLTQNESFYADDVAITYAPVVAYADSARLEYVESRSSKTVPGTTAAIGTNGTDLVIASVDGVNNKLRIDTVDPGSLEVKSTVVTTADPAFTSSFMLSGVEVGTFDFAGPRIVVKARGSGIFYVFDATTGAYLTADTFNAAPGGSAGFDWNGSVFVELATNSRLYKHTAAGWSGARTASWDAAFTWYDGNAGGTGLHETNPSPRSTFTMTKRARLTVTSSDIPNLGGADDPDRIGIYLASSPGGVLYRQLVTDLGVKSAVLTSAVFSGTAAPATNNFPGALPAQIVSSNGSLAIKGDGSVKKKAARNYSVACTTALTLTATAADVVGASVSVPVEVGEVLLVSVSFDFSKAAAATSTTATGSLLVNGTAQPAQAFYRDDAASAARATVAQTYLLSGLAAGTVVLKLQALGAGYVANVTHTTLRVVSLTT